MAVLQIRTLEEVDRGDQGIQPVEVSTEHDDNEVAMDLTYGGSTRKANRDEYSSSLQRFCRGKGLLVVAVNC